MDPLAKIPETPKKLKTPPMKLYRYPSKGNLMLRSSFERQKSLEDIAKDQTLLWDLMNTYIAADVQTIQRQISDHVEYTLARDRSNFDKKGAYQATAYSVRDRLIEYWNDTNLKLAEENPKRVYYLSIEYLLGRTLANALLNLGIDGNYGKALKEFGYKLEDLYEEEVDAGLGNGGLGRLAACYLDSMATQNYPCWGYGLRYTYGMFKQSIFQGWQTEIPDFWLKMGNPWEVVRTDVKYPVRFYGNTKSYKDSNDHTRYIWEGGEIVLAVAHDTPIPGFRTPHTINLRLWSSEPTTEFDLNSFNEGNYYKAIEKRQNAESISSVLYPNDSTDEGKILRLKQQYFFSCATIQDILRRFKKTNQDIKTLPSKVAIQLNDTHPTVSIPELMRVLMDEEDVSWEDAYAITRQVFAYTNHTVLPEALEKWPVPVFERLLPRHLEIIYSINHAFLTDVKEHVTNDESVLSKVSIIEESHPKMIKMANLAIIMSCKVNGVAAIHSDILQKIVFPEFTRIFPQKFINVTNGITPRRWMYLCNPQLCRIVAKTLNAEEFLTNLELIEKLRAFADDKSLQEKWLEVKLANKTKLAKYLQEQCKLTVDPNALFDIQVKRIHEYKRQFLNILRVVYLYIDLKRRVLTSKLEGVISKVVIFGGKAAPGYARAKKIIKLINSVAERVNNDSSTNNYLKVVFIPNYCVSLAELIIPASDISEHISTAGTEASGTSNMKFALNGGLIVGTLDGANIEIRDAIGKENMFTFGLTANQIESTRNSYKTRGRIEDPRLEEVVNYIRAGEFGDPSPYSDILESLHPSKDFYLLGADFATFLDAHKKVDETFTNKPLWAKMSILSTAGMGKFSSDRSVQEYAEKIWHVQPSKPVEPKDRAKAASSSSISVTQQQQHN